MPAKSVDLTGPFLDKIVVTIDQQADLAVDACWKGLRKTRISHRRAGHCSSIDGIRLAVGARPATGLAHHLGRHADDCLTLSDQSSFETPAYVSTIVNRPSSRFMTR